jgi:DNA-binding transcriptional MerR regulator
MTDQQELDLLIDLVKLVKKYGPVSFEELAKYLSSQATTQELPQILTKVAQMTRAIPEKKQKKEQATAIPKALISIEHSEPEKYLLLKVFYDKLTAKAVLPTLKDIKEFLRESGFPEAHADSRQKAINPLVSSLVKSSNKEILNKIQSISKYKSGYRSLEGWGNIILNGKDKGS